jgi:transcriptional antiterminator NusG
MNTGEVEHDISVLEGELVGIIDGPFKDFEGKVSEVDKAKGRLKVLVNMFGRETPVELDFLQIKKI